MEWQPIETAPKDGTRLLFWDGVCHKVGHWRDESYKEERFVKEKTNGDRIYKWFTVDLGHWDIDDYEINPTHWMPLPTPPSRR